MTPTQITAAIAAVGLLLYVAIDTFRKWQPWPRVASKQTATPPATLYAHWSAIVARIEANGYDAETLPVAEIPKALAIKK